MSVMAEEIGEQPEALARLVDTADEVVEGLARDLAAAEVGWVVIAARGSSDNAARYGQYLLGWRNRLSVALAVPSLHTVYRTRPRLDGGAAVAISQSGQSPDVVAVLEAARGEGRPAIALTNDPSSPLAAAATHVVELRAGPERAVAATKSYTNSLGALALLSAALSDGDRRSATLEALRATPDAVAAAVDRATGTAADAFDRYAAIGGCAVVGRGLNYATAFEVALKVRELTGVVAEAFSPADLLHGPIAALGPDTPAVLVAPDEPSLDSVRGVAPRLVERGVELVVLSRDTDLLERASTPVRLTAAPTPWLTPLTAVVPGQVLAHRLARLRDLDPDDPEGLQKVTRTR